MSGSVAVASAQQPTTPPKPDSAMQKPGAAGDTAMKQAGQVAVVDVNTATPSSVSCCIRVSSIFRACATKIAAMVM